MQTGWTKKHAIQACIVSFWTVLAPKRLARGGESTYCVNYDVDFKVYENFELVSVLLSFSEVCGVLARLQFATLLAREVRARGKHFFNLADAKRSVQALMTTARLVLEQADLAGLMTAVI